MMQSSQTWFPSSSIKSLTIVHRHFPTLKQGNIEEIIGELVIGLEEKCFVVAFYSLQHVLIEVVS